MKIVINEVPYDSIKVKFLGDLHIGSTKCDWELVKETVNEIKDTPDMYCVVLGDLINNSTKNSVGDVYSEPLTPMQQIQAAVNLLEPIKDKVLGIVTGNHERRTYKQDGIDIMAVVAAQLNLSDKYDAAGCLIVVKSANSTCTINNLYNTIYIAHGDGANGKLIGGKANSLARRGDIFSNVDVVCVGHTHSPLSFKQSYFDWDSNHSRLVHKTQLCINTSAFIDYEEYAELYGLRPSSKATPTLYLAAKKEPQCLI